MYKILLAGSLLLLFVRSTSSSQQIVNHTGQSFQFEDGNPTYDGDGIVNGIVVWRSGAVHVVNDYFIAPYTGFPNPVFIISPGAMVKIAGSFSTNNGTTWTPPLGRGMASQSGFSNGPEENVTIQMDGVTITDIRDDAVGGDTNGDGNASSPSGGATYIRFSGSPRDVLTNSTVKYLYKIGHIGSMLIANNTFVKFGGIQSTSGFPGGTQPIVLNASPRIFNNQFNLIGNTGSGVDLRGMTPVVEDNVFRDTAGVPYALWIGPAFEFDTRTGRIGPTSGTAIISNNRFFTRSGISLSAYGLDQDSLYSKLPFRAEINGNTMRGDGVGTGLQLAFAAQATVTNNDLSNYAVPLVWFFDPQSAAGNRTQCGLRINNNHFSLEGVASTSAIGFQNPQYWRQNVYIDMKNNYWGDPSGPLDTTASDSRSNPRGRGLKVISNTIDYVPFIGGGIPPQQDHIRLAVSSPSPSAPLAPGSSVTLNSNIDFYDLLSAPTGQIVVLVRDADGIILNQPGTTVNVTSGNHTATIPPIQFTTPLLSNVVLVEADIVPNGNFPAVRSNIISYTVNLPPSSLYADGTLQDIPGNIDTAKLNFTYTLSSTNPGTIELQFKERVVGTGTELSQFSAISIPAPQGIGRTLAYTTTLLIPLRDVSTGLKREITLLASLKNDAGTIVSQSLKALRIDDGSNRVRLTRVTPIDPGPPLVSRQHFLVGSGNLYGAKFDYTIATKNVTSWQVWVGFDKVLDASGALVYQYTPTGPIVANASTGTVIGTSQAVQEGTPIPTSGKKFRVMIRLVGPGGLIVGLDSVDFPILSPDANQARVVPANASIVAFTPIKASLNFTANQTAGLAVAEEFTGQYGGVFANTSPLENFYWRFIPLLRYWSVYDTLRDGTFTASVTFTYTPADIPSDPNFREDSLVVCGYNPLSQQLEALPSTLNRTNRTVTTAYTKFFDTWVVASKSTILVSAPLARAIPTAFSLGQNYPNPFNPVSNFQFSIANSQLTTLKVYDVLGREVATLVNEMKQPGRYEVQWDASNFSSGVYFYRLQTDGFTETKKLLLLR